jgi:hypothetical protein
MCRGHYLILPGHSLTTTVNVTWGATLNPTTDSFTGDIIRGLMATWTYMVLGRGNHELGLTCSHPQASVE